MRDVDLLIVGAGPAGSTLATRMVAAGRRVLIIDKASFPRDKTCAGWVTPVVWQEIGATPEDYGRDHVLQPITSFRVGLMGNGHCDNDHGEKPVSYGIRRCEFDHWLLQRSGAECVQGERVRSMQQDADGYWCLNGEWRAPWLVGAGGHFCPVAAHVGEGPGGHELAVTAKEIEFAMTPAQQSACAARGERPELWFCDDLRGYGWIFRKGEYLNIGLGREDNRHLGGHLDAFVSQMQKTGRLPADLPRRYKGHAYLLHGHAHRPLTASRCLLIGDAAGLAYTQSGEGIRPAIESALFAARALGRYFDAPQMACAAYEFAVRDRFGRRGDQPPLVRLPDWLKTAAAAPLMRSKWFTRKVVTEKWFLHADVPALEAAE